MVAGNVITLGKKLEFEPDEVSFAEGASRKLWEMLKATLMDDLLFRQVCKNVGAVEKILQTVLDDKQQKVI